MGICILDKLGVTLRNPPLRYIMLPRLSVISRRGGQALLKFKAGRCLSTTSTARSLTKIDWPQDWDNGSAFFIPQPPALDIADKNDAYVQEDEAPKSLLDTYKEIAGTSAPMTFGMLLPIYLLSKEIWIFHDETFFIMNLAFFLTVGIKKLGPMYVEWAEGERAATLAEYEKERNDKRDAIANELQQLDSNAELLSTTDELFAVFKDTRAMEAETKYRKNLLEVETEVKKRLDYQVELQNLKRKVEQQHMAQWLENAVVSSITPEQAQQTLLKCIDDIDSLANKHAATV